MDTHVLGCKVNYADTRRLLELLPESMPGAVTLVGTCCVTAEGEKQSRKQVRRASRRLGEEGRVLVTGCASRLDPEAFRAIADNVVVLEGTAREAARQARDELECEPAEAPAERVGRQGPAADGGAAARTRYFLKVQDGCANGCSYCIIPQVRGLPRSLPLARLLEEAAARVRRGVPELVVSGINVGAYRDGDTDLAGLLRRLAQLDGLQRLRLSSIEAVHVTRGLLEDMAELKTFAPHLHIPLQSGDDRLLADMGRNYDRRLFRDRLAMARQLLPGINITTDAIAGYPGEDEAAFENTLELVEACGITKVHVFGFSARPGTAAASRRDRVPPETIKERSRRLRRLSDRMGEAHRRRKLEKVSEILLESVTDTGAMTGLSADYTRFQVKRAGDGGKRPAAGTIAQVEGLSVTAGAVMGKVVD